MITFGYKSRINGPLRALVALAVGIMMIVYPTNALATVVKIIAAFMTASGVISLIMGLKDKEKGTLPLMAFNAVVNIIIAILLFVFAAGVAKFVIYLIGFVLLAFGIIQLLAVFAARRVLAFGYGAFILPAIVTLVGGFILFNPFAESVMTIVAGSSLALYGVSELISSWWMKKVMDAESPKVDEQEAQVIEDNDQIDEQ